MSQRTVIFIGAGLALVILYSLVRAILPESTSPAYDSEIISEVLRRVADENQAGRNRTVAQSTSTSSAYVKAVYKELFGLDLPSSARDQMQFGTTIAPPDLLPGDLIFFTDGPGYQVGFFIGGIEFGTYSAWRGAAINHLDNPSWSSRFVCVQRVIS